MICPRCRSDCESQTRFCPNCGWSLQKSYYRVRWNPRSIFILAILTGFLWGSGYALQVFQAGTKPTIHFQGSLGSELAKLKEAAEAAPEELEPQRAYARAVLEELRKTAEPDQGFMMEAADAFSSWLRLSPKDPEPLIALADLSFNAKVFDKAGELYLKYLQERPDDLAARARYASSLAFMDKSDQAIKELQAVLTKDPQNFHALAYLAIAYAQVGDFQHAKEIGLKALEHAPSPEAHARFKKFLDELESEKSKSPTANNARPKQEGVEALAQYISLNPVAGPKYVSFSQPSATELVVRFKNFPMQGMPAFAKQKFFAGIQAKAKELGLAKLEKITFVDADSGQAMDTLPLIDRRQ